MRRGGGMIRWGRVGSICGGSGCVGDSAVDWGVEPRGTVPPGGSGTVPKLFRRLSMIAVVEQDRRPTSRSVGGVCGAL